MELEIPVSFFRFSFSQYVMSWNWNNENSMRCGCLQLLKHFPLISAIVQVYFMWGLSHRWNCIPFWSHGAKTQQQEPSKTSIGRNKSSMSQEFVHGLFLIWTNSRKVKGKSVFCQSNVVSLKHKTVSSVSYGCTCCVFPYPGKGPPSAFSILITNHKYSISSSINESTLFSREQRWNLAPLQPFLFPATQLVGLCASSCLMLGTPLYLWLACSADLTLYAMSPFTKSEA